MNPKWYGLKYPSIEGMVMEAERQGAYVTWAEIGQEAVYFAPGDGDPAVIVLPNSAGPLRMAWLLAHELGHLACHPGGYTNQRSRDRQEAQASRWAACALIPEARIRHHQNASLDAMIAALSAHYEDLPLRDCASRRLAARIGRVRLSVVEACV